MARNRFHILTFQGSTPCWELFDGSEAAPCDPPDVKSKLPVLAVVPDRFFFFYRPKGLAARGRRNLRTAVKMQLKYFFPAPGENQETGTLGLAPGAMLGYCTHPEFNGFVQANEKVLERAGVVTTSFVLAWAAATASGSQAWTWQRNGGPRGLCAQEELHYFNGDGEEYRARLKDLQLDRPPDELDWNGVLRGLVKNQVRWSRLALPYQASAGQRGAQTGRWMAAGLVIGLIGLLFCLGTGLEWLSLKKRQEALREAVRTEYASVLGSNLGSDPYGQLLFKLEQLKGSKLRGMDLISLLGDLSNAAPPGFRVESLSVNNNSGNIRASVRDYNQLEAMLEALSADSGYSFTLEQATNTAEGVTVDIKVEQRR
jgi:hypothetical protein